MLIIGRRVGETIHLGPDVEIHIMDLTPSRVKIGIVAPKQLPILRGEMIEAARQNKAASQAAATGDSVSRLLTQLRSHNSPALR